MNPTSPAWKRDGVLRGIAELKRQLNKKPASRRAVRLLASWDQVKKTMREKPEPFVELFVRLYGETEEEAREMVSVLLNEEV